MCGDAEAERRELLLLRTQCFVEAQGARTTAVPLLQARKRRPHTPRLYGCALHLVAA